MSPREAVIIPTCKWNMNFFFVSRERIIMGVIALITAALVGVIHQLVGYRGQPFSGQFCSQVGDKLDLWNIEPKLTSLLFSRIPLTGRECNGDSPVGLGLDLTLEYKQILCRLTNFLP